MPHLLESAGNDKILTYYSSAEGEVALAGVSKPYGLPCQLRERGVCNCLEGVKMEKKNSLNEHVLFWEAHGKFGFLSQWFRSGFIIDGEYYRYAEQYMMAAKARLFGDLESESKIMAAKSPMIMKRLGRAVSGYDEAKWQAVGFDEVVKANFAKFSQNDRLKELLLATGDAVIAEASPKDSKWGIGIDAKAASQTDEKDWPGQNLLGKALMKVRDMLRNGKGDTKYVERIKQELQAKEQSVEEEKAVKDAFAKAKQPSRRKSPKEKGERHLTPAERDALNRLVNNESRNAELFVTTRKTLLSRINAGDRKAYEEFYNLYCPAMLKYLGLTKESEQEKDQWDLVHTVFANFWKRFAMVEDPVTGEKRVPPSIFKALNPVNKKTGKQVKIRFRQYLLRALENAKRTKWSTETKRGKLSVVSFETPIEKNGKEGLETKRLGDILENQAYNPGEMCLKQEFEERYEAMAKVFDVVMKAVVLDDSLDDLTKDVFMRLIKDKDSPSALAEKWDIKENYVYQIKHRNLGKAEKAARALFKFVGGEDSDYDMAINQLWTEIAGKKIKHYDKFMVALAKEMIARRKRGKNP